MRYVQPFAIVQAYREAVNFRNLHLAKHILKQKYKQRFDVFRFRAERRKNKQNYWMFLLEHEIKFTVKATYWWIHFLQT